ncbi:MAG: PVC-type heme-binding CxxCH protein [Gemmataceae bacterium]
MRYAIFLLPFLLLLTPVRGQRDAKIPDPDPELERKSFKVADGFEVNLWAADPLLAKPIQMNFDAAGRLWVASSETYPQIKPGQKANDKILILEDTKGVGKADKTTVFADGLLIPTGVEPGDGGAYVANSTDLIHLKDTDGDGKADQRRIVLSGFGTEDTHHILHTFRWGFDGNLYMNQSIYIHSHIETPHGVRRLNAGGVWQFRPETLQLEVFARGLVNSWGHHFDRFGQSFLTDGAGGEGVNYCFPGATYLTAADAPRILQGLNPGSPKYCGLEIVSGRHLPDDWQGNLITCDFRAHRVVRFVLAPSGSGYTARLMPDVIRATHPAFRPIDVKMGPDGAIYIADWYNPIIQHGEVDFRDPRRDVTHGRIWRLTAKGRKTLPNPDLLKASPEELVKQLNSPEDWTRHFARRTLKERWPKETIPALEAWLRTLEPSPSGRESDRLEALWTYQTMDVVEASLLRSLLEAKDARVRAAAVRVLSGWKDRIPEVLGLLERRVSDEHPQVRLEAVRALSLVKSPRSAELALRALDRPIDGNLDFALWQTLRDLESVWLPALQAGRFDFGGNVQRLAFALQAVGSDKVVRPLVELIRAGNLSPENEEGILSLLGTVGGPAELAVVLDRAGEAKGSSLQARLLSALEESARQRGSLAQGDRQSLMKLLDSPEESVATVAARLAGLYRLESSRDRLTSLLKDEKKPLAVRRAAIEGLAGLGGPASKNILAEQSEQGSAEVRQSALIALSAVDLEAAGERTAGVLQASKDGTGAGDVVAAFLQRKGGATLLARKLQGARIPADAAKVGVRAVRTSGRPSPELVEALTQAGGLKSSGKSMSSEERNRLLDDVARVGDAARGEQVFRRADQLCLKCHAVGGAGGQVGPDLSSIGGSAQVDYLLDSLIQPSKAIKENYHATLVTTVKGQQFTGIKVRQTPNVLVLRNDQDQEMSIPIRDIEEQEASKVSLMPEGLIDTLTRAELVDLVRFLSEMGKNERWSVGRQRVARRWQVLQSSPSVLHLLGRQGVTALLGDRPGLVWEPAYASVNGELPLTDLPRFGLGKNGLRMSVVRAQLDSASPARVPLKLNQTKGLTVWLDGEPMPVGDTITLELTPGPHTLTVAVDPREAKNGLRLEIEDSPASAGVRFIGGK